MRRGFADISVRFFRCGNRTHLVVPLDDLDVFELIVLRGLLVLLRPDVGHLGSALLPYAQVSGRQRTLHPVVSWRPSLKRHPLTVVLAIVLVGGR